MQSKQIDAVLALHGEERYKHFVKRVADAEMVWGLYSEGWALAATAEGTQVFPMWPAREYAALCAVGEWAGYEPRGFSIEDLIDELIPRFLEDGTVPGVFYTPADKGVTPSVELFKADLLDELKKYQ